MSEAESSYSLLQGDAIGMLTDREFFKRCVTHNYKETAATVGCDTDISARRVGEAYDYWLADVDRTLLVGIKAPTEKLDHFKHASFISFWLRRAIPINTTSVVDGWGQQPGAFKRRDLFLRYGNELCALRIGYDICLNYQMALQFGSKGQNKADLGTRPEYLKRLKFPLHLIEDYVMILKHKNMSPYSLYLMYKSLFSGLLISP